MPVQKLAWWEMRRVVPRDVCEPTPIEFGQSMEATPELTRAGIALVLDLRDTSWRIAPEEGLEQGDWWCGEMRPLVFLFPPL